MSAGGLCLSQISRLVGITNPTLHGRVNSLLKLDDKKKLIREKNRFLLTPEQIRVVINDQLNTSNGKVVYIGNLKGGVGKTTLAYLLVEAVSTLGLKTCAIDLDIQANLTRQFKDISLDPPVFSDIIEKKATIKDIIIQVSPTLSVLPSSLKNSLIQKTLSTQTPKHYLTWFNSLCLTYLRNNYEVIIVDTPPSLTTLNSIFCLCLKENDYLVIPSCADDFSMMGIDMFLEDVNSIRESYNVKSNPQISLLVNKFFQNQTSNIEMFAKISNAYPQILSRHVIKDCAKIRETITNKQHIGEINNSKELFEILAVLLKELNFLKGTLNAD